MSANSLPQTPVISAWLKDAVSRLSKVGIPSPQLDAEIILAYTLNKSRTYLHSHDDDPLQASFVMLADTHLKQRLNRIPVAYIVGRKEFYGRDFIVNSDTLIPRPESEDIITLLKQLLLPTTYCLLPTKLLDVGTGCGCLGVTAKLEFPKFDVTISDISEDALQVATVNSKRLSANVNIVSSNLLQKVTSKFNIIIANLPYVDKEWDRSPETNSEPALALFAADKGLHIIKQLINQAKMSLAQEGYLLIEADPAQHDQIISFAHKHQFSNVSRLGYAIAFRLDAEK